MSNIDNNAVVHPTAIIEDGAVIGANSYVGPYCCVGSNVVIGQNVVLKSHVVIENDTIIGDGCAIYPFASIGQKPQDLKYKNERSRLEIGKNTTIREYVTANIGTECGGMVTKIGDNCLIMAYCHIAHDCMIANNVILVNSVNLSGHVIVGENAIIGGMSAVKQFVKIGRNAMIGGFSGLERDVIPFGIVRNDRTATIRGLNIIGLKRHGFSIDEIKTMLAAYQELFEREGSETPFTENVQKIAQKYKDNKHVMEIIDFINTKSKNPLCTTKLCDEN